MKNHSFLYIGIILIACFGCNSSTVQEPTVEKCLKLAKLSPITHYKIIDTTISNYTGGFTYSFTLVINDSSFKTIEREIRAKPFYIKDTSNEYLEFAYSAQYDPKDTIRIKESAFIKNGNLCYQYFDRLLYNVVTITATNDSILTIKYDNI